MKAVGSNSERRQELIATIDARLNNMATFMATGEPEGFTLPKTVLQFREMDIPDLGIFPISSPSTLNLKQNEEKRNHELVTRIKAIFELLDEAKKYVPNQKAKNPSLSEVNRKLRRKVREGNLKIAGLSRAYHEQADKIEQLEAALSTAQDKLAKSTRELAELLRGKSGKGLRVVVHREDE